MHLRPLIRNPPLVALLSACSWPNLVSLVRKYPPDINHPSTPGHTAPPTLTIGLPKRYMMPARRLDIRSVRKSPALIWQRKDQHFSCLNVLTFRFEGVWGVLMVGNEMWVVGAGWWTGGRSILGVGGRGGGSIKEGSSSCLGGFFLISSQSKFPRFGIVKYINLHFTKWAVQFLLLRWACIVKWALLYYTRS